MVDYKIAYTHFLATDPVMAVCIAANMNSPQARDVPTKADKAHYAFHLYSSIISQQISTKAADKILQRFLELVGDVHDTERIMSIDTEEYRSIGLSRQKAGYIHSIAEHIQNGSVAIDRLDSMSNNEVIQELIKIKGVGQWTAEMFLLFTLARDDVFSAGDLGLLNAARRTYNNPSMTKQDLEELSENWKPYRSTVALSLWHSLDNMPKITN